jgi:hypothetical protein
VGPAEVARFLGEQGRVYPAVDDCRAAGPHKRADFVSAQRVAGVNADADDVSRLDRVHFERFKCFVRDAGVAELRRSGTGENEQPTRSDDADAEGEMTRIDEMNGHDGTIQRYKAQGARRKAQKG